MSETPAIGIDLGTTNTVVAMCVSLEKVEVIANSQGHRTMPSYVGFNNVEILTGYSAKYQAQSNSANTIFDAKRLMGRKYNDKSVQNDIKNWPFVVVNEGEYPKFKVTYKSEEKIYSPEEISAIVLKEVKSYAEAYIGKPISDVVITVPAYFNNSQRQATTDAAKIAGLNIQRIINEPTAAAIAYGANKTINCANFLIFDLGGGTFDVSIITVEKGAFEVRATTGNDHLGGEDFNNKLVAFFMDKFNSEYNCDMSKNKRSVERLRSVCENAKIQLSNSTIANIELDALFDGHDLYTTISRDEFEKICAEYFDEALELVRNVLAEAEIEKTKIDDIILIGGSTRIPKVQEMLQDYFGKELKKSINPDEAVAYGAAIQSGILKRLVTNVVLIDVIPLSLGIAVDKGEMSILIKRNTKKPYTKTKTYTTKYENQKSVQIKVYEGERALVQDNHFLGEFVLENIPPASKHTPNILVTFSVNNNGMLEVSAVEESTKMKKKIIVSKQKHLSDEEINDMIKKAEENKIQDEQIKKKFYHINLIKRNCYKRITDEEDESKKESYKEFLDWLDQNISEDLTKIRSKYKEFVPEGEEEECI